MFANRCKKYNSFHFKNILFPFSYLAHTSYTGYCTIYYILLVGKGCALSLNHILRSMVKVIADLFKFIPEVISLKNSVQNIMNSIVKWHTSTLVQYRFWRSKCYISIYTVYSIEVTNSSFCRKLCKRTHAALCHTTKTLGGTFRGYPKHWGILEESSACPTSPRTCVLPGG